MSAPYGTIERERGTLWLDGLEELPMPRSGDDWARTPDGERRDRQVRRRSKRSRTRSRHRGERDRARDAEGESLIDESLQTPEERAYAEARHVAEEKVQLWGKFWRLAIVVVPLLIFLPWLGVVIAFFGGIDLAKRGYRILYEPKLRQRFVDSEVSKRIQHTVHEERRSMEGEHARSLEKLSASIAHEIRNPITAAKSLVQQMGEDPTGPDNVEYASVALQELERVERSISHLLRFAREEDMRSSGLRMADVLESALETFRERAEREGIEIVRQFDSDGQMRGDAEQLRRVAINLIGNAMDSLADSDVDKPRVSVSMGENLAGTEVWVRLTDNGGGIDAEECEKIFNPFFTSKEHGTGLGLPITKKIVEAHGGSIEVHSPRDGGAEFVLTFPGAGATGGRS